jgi:hypothetical protein
MGSTIRQGLERYRLDVRPYKPDIVVSAYSGLHEHQQAPNCCSDDDRIRGRCGPQLATLGQHEFPRDSVRLLQACAWLRDLYLGPFWSQRELELQELRFARTIGTFDSPGVRRVGFMDTRDEVLELANEVRADGALLVILMLPHKPGGPLDNPVMQYYQQATEIGAQLGHMPVALGRLAFFEGVRTAGIQSADLFLPTGQASDCGHILLAQVLIDTILPRLPEVGH